MLWVSALQTFTAWGKVQDAFARPEGRAKQNGYRQMCGVGDAVRYSLYVTGNTLLNEARFDGTGVRIDGHRFAATSPGGLSKSSEGGAVWSVFDVSASPDRHPVKVLGSLLQKIKKNSLLCPLRSTECGMARAATEILGLVFISDSILNRTLAIGWRSRWQKTH